MANTPIDTNSTSTQTFFNGYFSQPIQVSEAVWGQVYGFFLSLTKDKDAANALAQSIISLTYNNSLDPLVVLQEFQKAPNSNNIKNLLISFFNASKGSTSKLGYKQNNSVNPYVARNIIV